MGPVSCHQAGGVTSATGTLGCEDSFCCNALKGVGSLPYPQHPGERWETGVKRKMPLSTKMPLQTQVHRAARRESARGPAGKTGTSLKPGPLPHGLYALYFHNITPYGSVISRANPTQARWRDWQRRSSGLSPDPRPPWTSPSSPPASRSSEWSSLLVKWASAWRRATYLEKNAIVPLPCASCARAASRSAIPCRQQAYYRPGGLTSELQQSLGIQCIAS